MFLLLSFIQGGFLGGFLRSEKVLNLKPCLWDIFSSLSGPGGTESYPAEGDSESPGMQTEVS